jgi:hypothetical protein
MKLFNYTHWEILDTYDYAGVRYCIQTRMNRNNGFKRFKVTRITAYNHSTAPSISKEQIEKVFT